MDGNGCKGERFQTHFEVMGMDRQVRGKKRNGNLSFLLTIYERVKHRGSHTCEFWILVSLAGQPYVYTYLLQRASVILTERRLDLTLTWPLTQIKLPHSPSSPLSLSPAAHCQALLFSHGRLLREHAHTCGFRGLAAECAVPVKFFHFDLPQHPNWTVQSFPVIPPQPGPHALFANDVKLHCGACISGKKKYILFHIYTSYKKKKMASKLVRTKTSQIQIRNRRMAFGVFHNLAPKDAFV